MMGAKLLSTIRVFSNAFMPFAICPKFRSALPFMNQAAPMLGLSFKASSRLFNAFLGCLNPINAAPFAECASAGSFSGTFFCLSRRSKLPSEHEWTFNKDLLRKQYPDVFNEFNMELTPRLTIK